MRSKDLHNFASDFAQLTAPEEIGWAANLQPRIARSRDFQTLNCRFKPDYSTVVRFYIRECVQQSPFEKLMADQLLTLWPWK